MNEQKQTPEVQRNVVNINKVPRIKDGELFRRGFVTTLGVGCALPFAIIGSSVVVFAIATAIGISLF